MFKPSKLLTNKCKMKLLQGDSEVFFEESQLTEQIIYSN